MIKFLKKYKKIIVIFSFAYIYMLLIFLVPSGFSLLTPGDISTINNVYEIEERAFENDLNTVSVYSWHELSVFQKWIVSKNSEYDLHEQYESDKNLSVLDITKQGNISKQSSHEQAIITAYKQASKVDSNIKIDYDFKGLLVYSNFGKFANIGDLVVGIDGVLLEEVDDYNDFTKLMYKEIIVEGVKKYQRRQKFAITLDTGKEINLNYEGNEFMSFLPKFEIKETIPQYNEKTDRRSVGGPSGGAMQSLAIYSALLNISYGDLKIAGTGTMELAETNPFSSSEDLVGNIGGLVQKYYTVLDNKVDIFIVPKNQYYLIEGIIDHKKIKVYEVDNFNEIIEIMKEHEKDA